MNWNRSNLSQDDIAQMQHDAMRRVRDMQARAQASVNQTNSSLPPHPNHPGSQDQTAPAPAPEQLHGFESSAPPQMSPPVPPQALPPEGAQPIPVSKEPPAPPVEKGKGILASITGIFDALGLGQDHLILILLIFVLLSSEDSDRTLILALCYLLL